VGERDKAIVLAHIQAEGYPQYLGPRTIVEERFRNPVLSRVASAASIPGDYSVHTASSDMAPVSDDIPQLDVEGSDLRILCCDRG
jgi:hypothetical protein